jgi:hypothetical protein
MHFDVGALRVRDPWLGFYTKNLDVCSAILIAFCDTESVDIDSMALLKKHTLLPCLPLLNF